MERGGLSATLLTLRLESTSALLTPFFLSFVLERCHPRAQLRKKKEKKMKKDCLKLSKLSSILSIVAMHGSTNDAHVPRPNALGVLMARRRFRSLLSPATPASKEKERTRATEKGERR